VWSHRVSLALTTLAPQPPHSPTNVRRIPCSQRFDRIFRNEGVTGSNPVSSTEFPGQSSFLAASPLAGLTTLKSHTPEAAHKTPARSTSFLRGAFPRRLSPLHGRSRAPHDSGPKT